MTSPRAILAALALVAVALPAEARPHHHAAKANVARPAVDQAAAERTMEPLRQAATACFAETVMANPKAIAHARAGRWYEAAGVIGFLCRPEVAAMVQAHDRLYGPKTGDSYFKGAYAKHLDRQLAERLQPLLERKAVASAEPPPERDAGAADAPGD